MATGKRIFVREFWSVEAIDKWSREKYGKKPARIISIQWIVICYLVFCEVED